MSFLCLFTPSSAFIWNKLSPKWVAKRPFFHPLTFISVLKYEIHYVLMDYCILNSVFFAHSDDGDSASSPLCTVCKTAARGTVRHRCACVSACGRGTHCSWQTTLLLINVFIIVSSAFAYWHISFAKASVAVIVKTILCRPNAIKCWENYMLSSCYL